ncbi:MAG: glycosyltransferase family 2 protein [Casimicrobiaceae bacterium]
MATSAPLITAIVPTYNSAPTLRTALASLVGQDCGDFEALVMGDGCSDGSEAVVGLFNDARLTWRNLPVNSGSQSEPNNHALRQARGQWIAYLGHDDLWFPWHLSGLLTAVTDRGADFAASTCLLLDPDGRHDVTGPIGSGRSFADQYTPPSSWLHRREIVDRIGLWRSPASLRYGVDFDYQRRIALAGYHCLHVRRLSVLKFPSGWWGNYDHSRQHPQAGYLERITGAPLDVERDLLGDLVARYVSEDKGVKPGQPLGAAVRASFRYIADGYGRDRWPMSAFLYWRQQRFMRRNRPRRGLPVQ